MKTSPAFAASALLTLAAAAVLFLSLSLPVRAQADGGIYGGGGMYEQSPWPQTSNSPCCALGSNYGDNSINTTGFGSMQEGYAPPCCTSQAVTSAPQAPQVALRQIPYTGVDFGIAGDMIYWLSLITFALSAAYLLLYYQGGLRILLARTFRSLTFRK